MSKVWSVSDQTHEVSMAMQVQVGEIPNTVSKEWQLQRNQREEVDDDDGEERKSDEEKTILKTFLGLSL